MPRRKTYKLLAKETDDSNLCVQIVCKPNKKSVYFFFVNACVSLCDSGGIQTPNLLIRSQMLYSVELRSLFLFLRVQM